MQEAGQPRNAGKHDARKKTQKQPHDHRSKAPVEVAQKDPWSCTEHKQPASTSFQDNSKRTNSWEPPSQDRLQGSMPAPGGMLPPKAAQASNVKRTSSQRTTSQHSHATKPATPTTGSHHTFQEGTSKALQQVQACDRVSPSAGKEAVPVLSLEQTVARLASDLAAPLVSTPQALVCCHHLNSCFMQTASYTHAVTLAESAFATHGDESTLAALARLVADCEPYSIVPLNTLIYMAASPGVVAHMITSPLPGVLLGLLRAACPAAGSSAPVSSSSSSSSRVGDSDPRHPQHPQAAHAPLAPQAPQGSGLPLHTLPIPPSANPQEPLDVTVTLPPRSRLGPRQAACSHSGAPPACDARGTSHEPVFHGRGSGPGPPTEAAAHSRHSVQPASAPFPADSHVSRGEASTLPLPASPAPATQRVQLQVDVCLVIASMSLLQTMSQHAALPQAPHLCAPKGLGQQQQHNARKPSLPGSSTSTPGKLAQTPQHAPLALQPRPPQPSLLHTALQPLQRLRASDMRSMVWVCSQLLSAPHGHPSITRGAMQLLETALLNRQACEYALQHTDLTRTLALIAHSQSIPSSSPKAPLALPTQDAIQGSGASSQTQAHMQAQTTGTAADSGLSLCRKASLLLRTLRVLGNLYGCTLPSCQ